MRAAQKDGKSLRVIAKQTNLGLRTARTIVEQDEGRDGTSKQTNLVRRREIDRLRAAAWRVRKRGYDELPKTITKRRDAGDALVKAARGIGRKD